MRVLLLSVLFITSKAFSQTADSSVAFSKLEQLLMEPRKMVRLVAEQIGSTNSVHVGYMEATDLKTGLKKTAACFLKNGIYSISFNPSNLHIDGEEIRQVIATLQEFKKIIQSKNAGNEQSYYYTTPSLVVVSMENRQMRQNKWDITIYKRFKYFNEAVPGFVVNVKDNDLDELIALLQKRSFD
jgi:hypothetical protein